MGYPCTGLCVALFRAVLHTYVFTELGGGGVEPLPLLVSAPDFLGWMDPSSHL